MLERTSGFSTTAFDEDSFGDGYKSPRQMEKAEPMTMTGSCYLPLDAIVGQCQSLEMSFMDADAWTRYLGYCILTVREVEVGSVQSTRDIAATQHGNQISRQTNPTIDPHW